jgi:DNA adenine methylase
MKIMKNTDKINMEKIINGFQKVKVPPLKTQGIKTKLVPFILNSIKWDKKEIGRWIEPFLGSGVVLLNYQPKRALVADNNIHIINFFKEIQTGKINSTNLKKFLISEGQKLEEKGQSYYYDVRKRFNLNPNSFDFIFLNRASFNGVMRFNKKGDFNVPFCKKNQRFRQAYITKICNQVEWVANVMKDKQWEFVTQDWKETLSEVKSEDFVYLDPPYIGRHTDYYNKWNNHNAIDLAETVKKLPCGFAYSMWKSNDYRENEHIKLNFDGYTCLTYNHFYHVGATKNLRNSIVEGLIINR